MVHTYKGFVMIGPKHIPFAGGQSILKFPALIKFADTYLRVLLSASLAWVIFGLTLNLFVVFANSWSICHKHSVLRHLDSSRIFEAEAY